MTAVSVAAGGRSRIEVTTRDRARPAGRSMADVVAFTTISALALVAPFERAEPIVHLPGQSISTVELVLLAGTAAWMTTLAAERRVPLWRTSLTTPWLTWIAVSILSSVLSVVSITNAAHMSARFALAFVVFLMTVSAATAETRRRVVLASIAVSAVAASVLVVLEFLGVPAVLSFLRAFRPGVSLVGTSVRAGGPFLYPTIASMYLEIAFVCTLGLLFVAIDRDRPRTLVVTLVVALAMIAEGVVLTFTRAGLLTVLSSLVLVAGLRLRRRGWDRGVTAVVAIAAVFLAEVISSRSLDVMRLRLTSEGQQEWFRAAIEAAPQLSLGTGERRRIAVRVTNVGRAAWEPASANPVRFSYHWLDAETDRVVIWEGQRTAFGATVAPGDTVVIHAAVEAPGVAGTYRLMWDVEQVHRLWFSTEPDAPLAISRAEVSGPLVAYPPTPRTLWFPGAAERPGRFVLWRAALAMAIGRPVLGVGPDNFRLRYGQYAGLRNADPRVHSNSMYLEILAGAGIAGACAFGWLAWRVLRASVAAVARGASYAPGLVAATAAIALHGLIDTFLGFTGTYVVMAIVLGLVVSAAWNVGEQHAHRV